MRFLQPQNLIWAFLLVLPVLLYLFRLKPKRVKVSTLNFFKTLARAHRESPWIRWLKRLLSFLLTAIVLMGVVGAMSQPVVSPSSGQLKRVVILVDRSASMSATPEDEDTNRLERGLQKVRTRVSGLPGGVDVMVLAYDRRPELLLSNTIERRRVQRAIGRIEVRPMEGNTERAMKLARRLASTVTPSAVWHVTDHPVKKANEDEEEKDQQQSNDVEQVDVVHIPASTGRPVNAGITAFRIRRKPMDPEQLQLFIEVQNSLTEPREAELELRFDGMLSDIQSLSLKPGEPQRLMLPIQPGMGTVVEAELIMEGDRLEIDNMCQAFLPDAEPIRVVWIHPDDRPFTRLALLTMESNNTITLQEGDGSSWPLEIPDDDRPTVYMFDSWVPDEWPEDHSVIAMNPPSSSGPLRVKTFDDGAIPVQNVRRVKQFHPISFGVAEGRLELHQTSVISVDGPQDPIWTGPSGPLLTAGTVNGQRLTVMPFSHETSGRFPLTVSFPVLLSNAIYWSAKANQTSGKRPAGKASVHNTGDVIRLSGSTLRWLELNRPSGSEASGGEESSEPSNLLREVDTTSMSGPFVELDRTGLWKTDEDETGTSLLLSEQETRLSTKEQSDGSEQKSTSSEDDQSTYDTGLIRGEITTALLWLVLIILLTETWLRNRWAVY